jgi:hypothetical protein
MTEEERQIAMIAVQWARDIRNCPSQRDATNMMRALLTQLVRQLSKTTLEIVSQADEVRLAKMEVGQLEALLSQIGADHEKPGIMLASTLRQHLARFWDLEVEADQAADRDDWGHSSFCEAERNEIEKKVEAQGFMFHWDEAEEQWMLALKQEVSLSDEEAVS